MLSTIYQGHNRGIEFPKCILVISQDTNGFEKLMKLIMYNFSIALEKIESTEIGLQLLLSHLFPDLNIAATLAIFQRSGNIPFVIDEL